MAGRQGWPDTGRRLGQFIRRWQFLTTTTTIRLVNIRQALIRMAETAPTDDAEETFHARHV
jgi:hypothetical protein